MLLNDTHIEAGLEMSARAREAFFRAVIEYEALGEEPQGLPREAAAAWRIAKKDIDNMHATTEAKATAGRKGGLARSKQKPSRSQAEAQAEAKQCLDSACVQKPSRSPSRAQAEDQAETQAETKLKEKEKEKEKEKDEGCCVAGVSSEDPDATRRDAPDAVYLSPPTPDEVRSYAEASCLPPFDAQVFVDHYSAQGWMLPNGLPMRDWMAQARKWAGNEWRHRAENEARKGEEDAAVDFYD